MKQMLKGGLRLALILVVFFIAWFIWYGFIKDQTPQFFPFNELQGEYSIVRTSDNGIFMVKYKGPNEFLGINKDMDGAIFVIVGKTDYDLNRYLGKKVILTKGNFKGNFTKQCIANNCKNIGGPYAAAVIEKMEEIQEAKPKDKVIDYEADFNANGKIYSSKKILCTHFAQSFLRTVQKTDNAFDSKDVYSSRNQRWNMAIDVETDIYNLCVLDLTTESLRTYKSTIIEKYQR